MCYNREAISCLRVRFNVKVKKKTKQLDTLLEHRFCFHGSLSNTINDIRKLS